MNTNNAARSLFLLPRLHLLAIAAGGLCAAPTIAQAQPSPAAQLLPALPAPPLKRTLVRGAFPDVGESYSVPVSSTTSFTTTPRSRTQSSNGSTGQADNPGWFRNTFSSMRDVVIGKSEDTGVSTASTGESSSRGFTPHGMSFAGGQQPRATPTPTAASPARTASAGANQPKEFVPSGTTFMGGQIAQPAYGAVPPRHEGASAGAAAPPGVYAGPPAYRWYGWGSTTPGANPYSPNGQYPRGSANWYTQTGATPGAFPVPVTLPARSAPAAEPAYVSNAQSTNEPVAVVAATASRTSAEQLMPVPIPTTLPVPVPPQGSAVPTSPVMPQPTSSLTPQPTSAVVPQAVSLPDQLDPPADAPRMISTQTASATPTAATPVSIVRPQPVIEPPAPWPVPATPTIPVGPALVIGTGPIAMNSPAHTTTGVSAFTGLQPASSSSTNPMDSSIITSNVATSQPIAVGQGSHFENDLSWQSAAKKHPNARHDSDIAPTQRTEPRPASLSPKDDTPRWQSPPSTGLPRSITAEETTDVTTAIRSTCEGRVSAVSVVRQSPNKLIVGFTAPDETTARAVAADIGRLSVVKTQEVNFEACVAAK